MRHPVLSEKRDLKKRFAEQKLHFLANSWKLIGFILRFVERSRREKTAHNVMILYLKKSQSKKRLILGCFHVEYLVLFLSICTLY